MLTVLLILLILEPILAAGRKKFNHNMAENLLSGGHTSAMCLVLMFHERNRVADAAHELKRAQNYHNFVSDVAKSQNLKHKVTKMAFDVIVNEAKKDAETKRLELETARVVFTDSRVSTFSSPEFAARERVINAAYERAYRQDIR